MRPRAVPRRPARGTSLWWLSPGGALLLLVPATLLLTLYLDDDDFRLFYRTPKSVTPQTLLLVATAVLLLAVAATLVAALVRSAGRLQLLPPGGGVPPLLRQACQVLFWLTIAGYAAFLATGAARGVTPGDVLGVLLSQDNYAGGLKGQFGGVAGITTLTQCGIAFVTVATYVLLRERDRRLVGQVVVVVVLTLLRSYVNSERLALVEIGIPAVAVLTMAARHSARRASRVWARLAPLVLAPLLFVLFAAFEYSRSWQFFSSRTDQPFGVFAGLRLVGYYATAYNNGHLQLEHDSYPGRLPRDSLMAFWEAPGIAQLNLYDRLSAPPPATAQNVLERFGNPEFNNLGGVTTPFVDFGMVGGFVVLAVLGVVLGLLYRGFRDGAVVGALLYPVAVTGLLDLPRYLYWTQGRVVPAVVCLLAVAVVLLRADRRARRPRMVLRPRAAPPARPAAEHGGGPRPGPAPRPDARPEAARRPVGSPV